MKKTCAVFKGCAPPNQLSILNLNNFFKSITPSGWSGYEYGACKLIFKSLKMVDFVVGIEHLKYGSNDDE